MALAVFYRSVNPKGQRKRKYHLPVNDRHPHTPYVSYMYCNAADDQYQQYGKCCTADGISAYVLVVISSTHTL